MKVSHALLISSVSGFLLRPKLSEGLSAVKVQIDSAAQAATAQADVFEATVFRHTQSAREAIEEVLDVSGGQSAKEWFKSLAGKKASRAWFNSDEEACGVQENEGPHPGHPGDKPHPVPGHGRPHHPPPEHRNPHDQRDKTLYEILEHSEYFTILHEIVKSDKHIVAELNKTAANLTLFAPTDRALERFEKHKLPVDYLKKILLYHTLPSVVTAGGVLRAKTLETLYKEDTIGQHQRLAVDINLRGITLNYYARIIYVDVFASNGVLHAIDNLLFPPPPVLKIAEMLPSSFSTFVNAAYKTGIVHSLNETVNATIFAPSNVGFAKLGARINAYLFSDRGKATLEKLLKYHVVPDTLFYSDHVIQGGKEHDEAVQRDESRSRGLVQHFEFSTLVPDEKILVDVGEWGRFKRIVFNGRSLGVSDLPAKNGVLSKIDGVILPYRRGMNMQVSDMSIEDFEALFENSTMDESELYLDMKDVL